ncbi:CLASP N terminal [Musa troglodytarum]|uniref:CLASP N terminal n=1 Tax=Musa troglodytarum TaxID=320322 RepID=A0A9E7EP47_9LILI|nr:CLASP N terminal [Musa troglodytarum]
MATEDEKLLKDAKKLPWDERLLHKNWKVRNDANIDLAAVCDSITDPKDPRLRELGKHRSRFDPVCFLLVWPLPCALLPDLWIWRPFFRKTVADSNAPVQEKALDALIAFLRAADADAGRYAKEVCDSIVAKCLTGRPKTVEKAQAAFLLWVELEAAEVFLILIVSFPVNDLNRCSGTRLSAWVRRDEARAPRVCIRRCASMRRHLGTSSECPIQFGVLNRFKAGLVRNFLPQKPRFMPVRPQGTLVLLLPPSLMLSVVAFVVDAADRAFLYCRRTSTTVLRASFRCRFLPLSRERIASSSATDGRPLELPAAVDFRCFHRREAMEKAIKNKVAKAVVPAIDVMFQALSEFGAKVVPPKKILKMLPELFDHQDQNVRASSKGLTLELCRWIGKEPKKELEAELANVSGIARPTRKIRSEQDKEPEQEVVAETVGAGASEESASNGHPSAPQEIDEYELVDPVDILTPLDKSGFWDGVKAAKWSERRDAVAELAKLASTKRIAPGDFSEICRTLKKLVTDVNLAVSVEAIQAIGNLAKGLRNHFAASSRFLLPVLLEKLKEKKPVLTEALSQTLQAMHKSGCLTLADVIEGKLKNDMRMLVSAEALF